MKPTELTHDTEERSASYEVPAVRKAIRLLEVLCASPEPLGVTDLSRLLGLNKNMVFRLLNVLSDEGWLIQEPDEPRYRVSPVPFRLFAHRLYKKTLCEAAAEPLRAVWDACGESTYLGILHGHSVLFVEHLDGRGAVRIAGVVGGEYPLHCSAAGKVLLAHSPAALFRQLTDQELHRYTEHTITDPVMLRVHLDLVREQGWAMDNEEHGRGVLCCAAPVWSHTEGVVGAIGVSATTIGYTRFQFQQKIIPLVVEAAAKASRQMGYRPELVLNGQASG